MRIKIIAVGKIKEPYILDGIRHYVHKINQSHKLELVEVVDEQCPENLSSPGIDKILSVEGARIRARLHPEDFPICLAIQGKMLTENTFGKYLYGPWQDFNKTPCFIIGGSLGLSGEILNLGPNISFSPMTFPHQLMRLVLIEQISGHLRNTAG